jgi:hypothetical protein
VDVGIRNGNRINHRNAPGVRVFFMTKRLLRLGSARVSRAGERVLAIANFARDCSLLLLERITREDCFGATPKPARGTRALPR